jgi:DNA polymerase-3 subunit epsilon
LCRYHTKVPKTPSSEPHRPQYVVFDVETTGLYPQRGDRVIEIGAVVLRNGETVEQFHSLVNSGRRIPESVQKLHGITNKMLADEPAPEEVFSLFHQFIGRTCLVAHNAKFDMAFLRHEFGRQGLSFVNKCRCTFKTARRLFPRLPDYKLQTVCRHLFGDELNGMKRHRALDDALLTAKVWLELQQRAALSSSSVGMK